MEYRVMGSFWRHWKQTLVLAAMVVAGQALSTWYLASQQSTLLSTVRTASEQAQFRGMGGGPGPQTPPDMPGPGANGSPSVPLNADPSNRWTPKSTNTVERLDSIIRQRIEVLAKEKGEDPATLLPDETLRKEAIASGDLRSEAAQRLIAEYTKTLNAMSGTSVDILPPSEKMPPSSEVRPPSSEVRPPSSEVRPPAP